MKSFHASGKRVYFDDTDEYLVKKYSWHIESGHGYAVTRLNLPNGRKPKIYLHRIIAGAGPGEIIDHINRNKLDNRKENLRKTDRRGNAVNSKLQSNNTSGYRGVTWNKCKKRWKTYINVNRKQIYLGSFVNKKDAAIAFNKAALKYNGPITFLNPL